ncbi:MAG: bifunctional 3-demethylubiquinol 3-O-methyltransferase/2-polyprenyl-6-hydroxyphenol methylase [Gammaproteobacteria bacterium RIFCSPLOWO2_02_FULL_61_13]|nr:MAG: bifunctional 3-demethylubiquinol 3-O-methyltransferase/2-polyprenyl-6-hydroxyphenol methylase [Gammaproteobacteria bacterium RIFCSPLOWO2_02_FULL_61_13]
MTKVNLDPAQITNFERLTGQWWDPEGPLRTLHVINPIRLRYIDAEVRLSGKQVLDLGCGGGLLSEAMAMRGATVTGVDASEAAIRTARSHGTISGARVNYVHGTAESLSASGAGGFQVITCMELVEHVPDPDSTLQACARLLQPGGDLILSTLNRNLKAYLGAVVAAEYLFRLLPIGTHDYARFIRPAELRRMLARHGFTVIDLVGLQYFPWLDRCSLSNDVSINYMVHARRDAAA